jgi:hypothetical protein
MEKRGIALIGGIVIGFVVVAIVSLTVFSFNLLGNGEGDEGVAGSEDSVEWVEVDRDGDGGVDEVVQVDSVGVVVSTSGGGSSSSGGGSSSSSGSVCVADCSGKICGDDGCSGSCGTCLDNETCSENVCVVLPSCVNESGCPVDYYENNSCLSDDVVRDFNNFSCVEEQCVINISVEFVEDCEDGLFCTGVESCSDGSCVSSGEPCDDGVGCTIDSCDEANDVCNNVPDDDVCIGDKPECNESVCVAGVGCDYLPSGCEVCDVVNMPVDLLVGTSLLILPVAGGSFIDGGTADAVRGLDNLMGPSLGDAPDVGAYELGLGVPWHGPRNFTDLLVYGLPDGWSVVENRSEQFGLIGDYLDLGAFSNVDNNDFRLLITRDNPRAFILVVFEEMSGGVRWIEYENYLVGDVELIEKKEFRDGLGATIVQRDGNVNLLGVRVDGEGILKVVGGVDAGDFDINVQNDFYTFIRSLYYAWYLQDAVSPPIDIDFVAPLEYGVDSVGSDASYIDDDAVVPGILYGDVTLTSASITWDVEGDVNLNANASMKFRRQGEIEWRDAMDLFRVNFTDDDWPFESVNYLSGSIFHLSPGTVYEINVSLLDSDGGSETRVATFTTRSISKIVNPRMLIEVRDSDDINNLVENALPGDTFLFHGGNYNYDVEDDEWEIPDVDGTYENPILLRQYGDGDVKFDGLIISGDYTWIDGFTTDGGYFNGSENFGTVDDKEYISIMTFGYVEGVTLTRNSVSGAVTCIVLKGSNWLTLDNKLAGLQDGRPWLYWHTGNCVVHRETGHVTAFNDIFNASDAVDDGERNMDIHNNLIHDIVDDCLPLDRAWDNYRVWENLCASTRSGFSFQPINGGPWYIFRNQVSGTFEVVFKMRGVFGAKVIVGNTLAVGSRVVQHGEELFDPASIFINNFWGFYNPNNSPLLDVYNLDNPGDPDYRNLSLLRLWDYNRYDVSDPNRVFNGVDFLTLSQIQSHGIDLNSELVDVGDCVAPLGASSSGGFFMNAVDFVVDGILVVVDAVVEVVEVSVDFVFGDSDDEVVVVDEIVLDDDEIVLEDDEVVLDEDLVDEVIDKGARIICVDNDNDGYNVTTTSEGVALTGNLLKEFFSKVLNSPEEVVDCGVEDCDDLNADVNPSVEEVCGDGVDNDCDGVVDCVDEEVVERNVLTGCGVISEAGDYKLVNDVSSEGTCFTIDAENVELDCGGFEISYGNSAEGYGVYSDKDSTSVKNCVINEGNVEVNGKHGIWYNGVDSGLIEGNEVNTIGVRSRALMYNELVSNTAVINNNFVAGDSITVEFTNSDNNEFSDNDVVSKYHNDGGIWIQGNKGSDNNVFNNNKITIFGGNSEGMIVGSSSYNIFDNLIIEMLGISDYAIEIVGDSYDNVFSNLDINAVALDSKGIFIGEGKSNTSISDSIITATQGIDIYVGVNVEMGSFFEVG